MSEALQNPDAMKMIADLVTLNAKITWAQSNALGFMAELEIEGRLMTPKKRAKLRADLRSCMESMAVYTNQLGDAISRFGLSQSAKAILARSPGEPS